MDQWRIETSEDGQAILYNADIPYNYFPCREDAERYLAEWLEELARFREADRRLEVWLRATAQDLGLDVADLSDSLLWPLTRLRRTG